MAACQTPSTTSCLPPQLLFSATFQTSSSLISLLTIPAPPSLLFLAFLPVPLGSLREKHFFLHEKLSPGSHPDAFSSSSIFLPSSLAAHKDVKFVAVDQPLHPETASLAPFSCRFTNPSIPDAMALSLSGSLDFNPHKI